MQVIHQPHLHESAITAADFPALGHTGISIIGHTSVTDRCTRKPKPDDLTHTHLHITLDGSATAEIDGKMAVIPANHAYVVPAGVAHWQWHTSATVQKPWQVVFVCMSPRFKFLNRNPHKQPFMVADCNPLDLLWAYQRLHRELLQPARPTIISNLIEMIAYHVNEVLSPTHKPPLLIDLWTRVTTKPNHPWNLDDMARIVGMSKESLRQTSLREVGRSPLEHVTHLRMRHAATLLLSGRHRVEDAAQLVGYQNPSNFSTAFKRAYGVCPKHYQQSPQS